MMQKRRSFAFLVPAAVVAVFVGLAFLRPYETLEDRLYDLLLHVKPAPEEHPDILLVDVDDAAIENVGMWPWSRDIMGEGLVVMKELGARYVVFDIEYTEASPRGVDARFLEQEIPQRFAVEFDRINANIENLFQAIRSGNIGVDDAHAFSRDLAEMNEAARDSLLAVVSRVARDNDRVLADGARFFQRAYFTVTTVPEEEYPIDPAHLEWLERHIALDGVSFEGWGGHAVAGLRPALPIFLQAGAGAGSPTVVVDRDGVQRRIDLISVYEGRAYPQLVFAPLLDWLGRPEVVVRPGSIMLRGARMPDGTVKDLRIPLAHDRRMLLDWPKQSYADSYRHISYYTVYLHSRQEENLVHNLRAMDEAGLSSYYRGSAPLMRAYDYAERLRREIMSGERSSDGAYAEYRKARDDFFEHAGAFLAASTEREITLDLEAILSSDDVPDAQKAEYAAFLEYVVEAFGASRSLYEGLKRTRAVLRSALKDAFCIIGWTGTSTTDIGVNPFDASYINVGTHATVLNTILKGRFLDDTPRWFGLIAAALLSALVIFVTRRMDALPSVVVGLAFVAGIAVVGVVIFVAARIYLAFLTPMLAVFFTFVAATVANLLRTSQERSYIRHAFGHYLSTDVINELLDDPDKLSLGGEKKYMTALFTDIKGFSSISEQLDPTELVALLNEYLTVMSNTVLEQRGTIDKYEGDAIISFFGAPVEYPDHARRACLAAARMKRAERQLNERFLSDKASPAPLLTRVGINTGDMVVGNMGTATKMDYTIMGNSVNLAARLEGVNKQYGTWILVSEMTRNEAGEGLVFRRLDRVRVVGIQQAVRLYELVGEESDVTRERKSALELFGQGLEYFEQKDWTRAAKAFSQVLSILEDDGPGATYLKRCQEYLKTPPPKTWDGVFNLTAK